MKKQNGITLIALIITIIVMLILVGVTINVALNGGLISTTQKAAKETELRTLQEELMTVKALKITQNGGTEPSDYGITFDDLDLDEKLKSKYESKLVIGKDGEFYYNGEVVTDENERKIFEEVGIKEYKPSDPGNPTEYIGIYNTSEDGKKTIDSIKDDLTGTYKIMENIDLPADWEGIDGFSGTLDGNGKSINITSGKATTVDMDGAQALAWGIFININNGGTVKNLTTTGTLNDTNTVMVAAVCVNNSGTIENCINKTNVTASGFASGFVAYQNNGIVNKCVNDGTTTANGMLEIGTLATGIVGYQNNGTIENCTNNGLQSSEVVSGIVGLNYGTIQSCINAANLINYGSASGVACLNNGTITKCGNTGNMGNGTEVPAGIAGDNTETGIVEGCYNTGNINGNRKTGGIIGNNAGIVRYCYNTGEISHSGIIGENVASNNNSEAGVYNCYNIGKVTEYQIARNSENRLADAKCFYLSETATEDGGVTADTMKSAGFISVDYLSPDFFKQDTENINNGYPILKWQ